MTFTSLLTHVRNMLERFNVTIRKLRNTLRAIPNFYGVVTQDDTKRQFDVILGS